jgi:rare lipoprotein A
MVSLVALRSSKTPDDSVELMAGSRIDFSTRLSSSTRASRGKPRVMLTEATTTTTQPPPPPTTAKPKPKPVVKKSPPTTAKPKAQTASAKPAARSTTPTTASTRPMPTAGGSTGQSEEGRASWYDAKYHADNPWICAHKTIPKGTVLTVTNVNTGASINCEVGDRGPYVEGRILDLSKYAFSRLANPSSGLIWVKITW